MGKARIVSALGDGAYLVELEYKRDQIDAEIAGLQSRLIDLSEQMVTAAETEAAAMDAHEQAMVALSIAVAEYTAVLEANPDPAAMDDPAITAARDAVTAATTAAVETDGARQAAVSAARTLRAREIAMSMRLTELEGLPGNPEKIAYCADYSAGLGGTVGTIELPASEGDEIITIRPAHPGTAAAYDALQDGQLMHRAGMSPEQAYFNAAILPGWQRHMPLYRSGVLTAVDKVASTGSVNIGNTASSAASLPVNAASTLSGVPILYMDCNAAPFEVGDRVVVRFYGDWGNPTIVGFETNPKPCGDYGTPAAGLAPSMAFLTDTALLKSNGLLTYLPGLCVGGACSSPYQSTTFVGEGPICNVEIEQNSTGWVPVGDAYYDDDLSKWVRVFTIDANRTDTVTDLGYTAEMDHLRGIYLGGVEFFFRFAQTFGRSGTYTTVSHETALWSVEPTNHDIRRFKQNWNRTEQRTEAFTDTISTRMIVNDVDAGIVHTTTSTSSLSYNYSTERIRPNAEESAAVIQYERTFNVWEKVYEISNDNVHDPMQRGGYDYAANGSYTYAFDDTWDPTTVGGAPDPFYPVGTVIAYSYSRTAFGSPVTFAGNVSGAVNETMVDEYTPSRPLKPLVEFRPDTETGIPSRQNFRWY
jgi:hypothetical protein